MFCYQCQEAARNTGCTSNGVCGKTGEVADLQDLLIYQLKGISYWAVKARAFDINDKNVNSFVMKGLFTTVTNVNFDAHRMLQIIHEGKKIKDEIKEMFLYAYKKKNSSDFNETVPAAADWTPEGGEDELLQKATQVGVLAQENEDVRSLRELLIYGIKGVAAYADHAYILGQVDEEIMAFFQEALAATLDDSLSSDDLVALVLKAGEFSVKVMALLDKANTESFGNPEITTISTGTKEAPGILISGHDLLDLKELLEQTEGTGINIYTHGEMLPANAYPELKKYKHLAGNFGTSWYNQQHEFDQFNGPILMTTNCIQKPRDSYKDRIFTTGLVAWEGVTHIAERENGGQKDFSAVINKAKAQGNLAKTEGKEMTVGFAHNAVLGVADKVVDAIKGGAIKRFFVMGGCDGRHKEREYHTDLAEKLGDDTVILTAGCAKFRYNNLDLGDIGGIPRVLDAGQCNDSYSLVVIALKLAEVFGLDDVNKLPISFNIMWYEQKAVCVLLALLFLGVKGIRLGPTVPAFLSPNVLNVLVENFDIKPISTVDADIAAMMEGK